MRWMLCLIFFLCSASYAGMTQNTDPAVCSVNQIKLGNPALEFCINPEFLTGGRILADNGLMVLWSATRHLNIETHSASQWDYTESHFNEIPAALIFGDMRAFSNHFLTELEAVRQVVAADTGFIRAGERPGTTMNVYFSIGDQIAYLFVEHKQNPGIFSQITIHGFTEQEIMELLEGLNDDRLN